MKRFLSLFLVVVLAATMMTGISLAEGKRTLTITAASGVGSVSSDVYQKLAESLGFELQIVDASGDDVYTTMLASGNLGDIVIGCKRVQAALDSGLALNIDPYIDEYAPNLKDPACVNSMDVSRQLMSPDGGLYLIPTSIGLHKSTNGGVSQLNRGYVVRWDYYKELGCPEINNDDDYIAVLQQMMANHPTTEEGYPTLLYGVEKSLGDMGGYHSAFKTNIAVNTWSDYQYKSDIFTNEVYDGYLDLEHSRYWDDMVFQNKIYRLGLYDIDCFTMSYTEYEAKVQRGQYMGLYYGFWEKSDECQASYVVVPSSGMVNYVNCYMVLGQMPNWYLFVNKNSQNIDLAMTWINYMYDKDFNRTKWSGEQGVTWDYDENGVPTMTAEALAGISAGDDYWINGEGKGGYGTEGTMLGYAGAVLADDGYPMNLALNRENAIAKANATQKDFAETYGVEYWIEAVTAVEKDFRNDLGETLSACMTTVSTADARVISNCNDILTAGMATMIMSETDEEFEANKAQILADLEATGEAEVFQRYKEQWDKNLAILQPLHDAGMATSGIELYPVD